jgi:hypothetical protein
MPGPAWTMTLLVVLSLIAEIYIYLCTQPLVEMRFYELFA